MLKVHEIFKSIQCEGPFTGVPAVFIRLYGCTAGCPWCDTPQGDIYKQMTDDGVVRHVVAQAKGRMQLVVITGGEPLEQDIAGLLAELVAENFVVQIETNGGHAMPSFHHESILYVCSPKPQIRLHESIVREAVSFRYTVDVKEGIGVEGLPIGVDKPPRYDCVTISPCNNDNFKDNIKLAVTICMEHNYVLGTQIHKFLEIQ